MGINNFKHTWNTGKFIGGKGQFAWKFYGLTLDSHFFYLIQTGGRSPLFDSMYSKIGSRQEIILPCTANFFYGIFIKVDSSD